jgi:hypothetical protein
MALAHSAYHEAGHAVLARALCVPAGKASIIKDEENLGYHESADPIETNKFWLSIGRVRPKRHARDACAMVAMAGAVAETIFLGERYGGHWADLEKIERLIPEDPEDRLKTRLSDATNMLARRHSTRIDLLAAMLRACGTLEGWEIDKIFRIGRPP